MRPVLWLALCAGGCVTKADELASLDRDGDGWYHEAAAEVGEVGPFDCDDADATVGDVSTWWADADGDGFGDEATAVVACHAPAQHVAAGQADCDDATDEVFPGAPESCDDVDSDCDGLEDADDSDVEMAVWYADEDLDEFGDDSSATEACFAPTGFISAAGDCDDDDATVYLGADEICDDVDSDCDGLDDVDDTDVDEVGVWYDDADEDGYGDEITETSACFAPSGFIDESGDCDDGDGARNPGEDEVCNAVDDDCDGTVNEGFPSSTWYADSDADTYGDEDVTQAACSQPTGYVALSGDCDDTIKSVSPSGTETCNTRDDDCDGDTDEGVTTTYYADADLDGYGVAAGPVEACSRPTGYATNTTDCDDASASDHPGAVESVANGDDEDCDGVDSCYVDGDVDGFGSATTADSADLDCADSGESALSTDCADDNDARHPDALEICDDAVDDDCDGLADPCRVSGSLTEADADVVWTGEVAGDAVGSALDGIGDFNGDGYGDIVIGSAAADGGTGRAYLVQGGPTGGSLSTATAIYTGDTAGNAFGSAVAGAGDINGDGYDDLLFGAPTYDSGATSSVGRAYLILGPITSGGVAASASDMRINGESAGDLAGSSVGAGGDVNGDGYMDMLIGAPGDDGSNADVGALYVLRGSKTPFGDMSVTGALSKLAGAAPASYLGWSVASADLDGDGLDDVLTGSPGVTVSGVGSVGAIYGFISPLPASDTLLNSDMRRTGRFAPDGVGTVLKANGDLNGDGYADIATASTYYSSVSQPGVVYIFEGPVPLDSESVSVADATLVGEANGDEAGTGLSISGDYDGDTLSDVLIGAPGRDNGTTLSTGATYLLHGPVSGTVLLSSGADAYIRGSTADLAVGQSVTFANMDGDAYADILVGAPGDSSAAAASGAIYFFFGGP